MKDFIWIKNQSRDTILATADIFVCEKEISIADKIGVYCVAGKYETEGKAQKVFDEICQSIINDINYFEMPLQ